MLTKYQMKALVLATLQGHIGGCREWPKGDPSRCGAPAEYVLWGKLLPQEALGPRCYAHAAGHVGHDALARRSNYALINLDELAEQLVAIVLPVQTQLGPEPMP